MPKHVAYVGKALYVILPGHEPFIFWDRKAIITFVNEVIEAAHKIPEFQGEKNVGS